MEFGKLSRVDDVNWELPAEDPLSAKLLSSKRDDAELHILYGAPAWGHAEWIGKIYPAGCKRTEFLHHYARHFTCVELNTSHYRIPLAETTRSWIEQVTPSFIFCAKMYQGISHARNGLRDRQLLMQWFEFLQVLGSHRGPTFLQLPPQFTYGMKAELFHFLQNWPAEFELSIEFRHPSWFVDGQILPALTDYLHRRQTGLVITDVAGRRDVLHTSLSADFSMLRFIGNSLHGSDFVRAKTWTERFIRWREIGLRRLYLFIHEPDDVLAPEMTGFFLQCLRERGGWDVPWNPLPESQLTLL